MADNMGTAREPAPQPDRSQQQDESARTAESIRQAAELGAGGTRLTAVDVAENAQRIADFCIALLEFGRGYWSAWSNAQAASLRAAYDVQNATIQSATSLTECAENANRNMLNSVADALHKSQDASHQMFCAGVAVIEAAVPAVRR